jgi:DNA-binding response OmpR family regulator
MSARDGRSRSPNTVTVDYQVLRGADGSGNGVRVLLFEDHSQLREVLQQVLTDDGYTVSLCPSREDVLAGAAGPDGCVALVDAWGGSFHTLVDEERAEIVELARAVPTVMLTARPWAATVSAEELGLAGLATKPIDVWELSATLLQAARRGAEAEPAAATPDRAS